MEQQITSQEEYDQIWQNDESQLIKEREVKGLVELERRQREATQHRYEKKVG